MERARGEASAKLAEINCGTASEVRYSISSQ